jgi:hypothetical protein
MALVAAVPWDELSEDYGESCRRQADHVGDKLTQVGCGLAPLTDWSADPLQFTRKEVKILARIEHERWIGPLCQRRLIRSTQ